MRGLKALVIGMGILIVAGLVIVGWAVVNQAGNLSNGSKGFDPAAIDLPAGAVVRETRLDGNRIVVRIDLAAGGSRLLILDARTGELSGTIDLKSR